MTNSSRPLIGLTPSHNIENDDLSIRPTYIRALRAAGALPLIFPLEISRDEVRQLAALCHGFLFTGGPDPHPFLWGEEVHEHCGTISARRDQLELDLLSEAMQQKKPILGICRGAQMLNIGLGGDIYQDIKSQHTCSFPIAHTQPAAYSVPTHHVTVADGTRLSQICGSIRQLAVNSCHHQAVRRLAPGLMAGAVAPDGIIEEIEMADYPFLIGVQWHPEYLWENDETSAKLFRAFVQACQSLDGQ